MIARSALAIAVALAACAKEQSMVSTIRWQNVQLTEIGVSADMFDGVPLRRAPGVVTQQGAEAWISFARGADATLEAFAESLAVGRARVELGAEEPATLCGHAAKRLVATRIEEGGEAARDGRFEQVAPRARVYVAVAAEIDGAWTRAAWIVEAPARDRLRADEQHFFEAIRR